MSDIFSRLGELPIALIVIAALVALALGVLMLARAKWGIVVVAGMFFVASLGMAKTDGGVEIPNFLSPITRARSDIFMLIGVFLYVALVGQLGRLPRRAIPPISGMLLTIALYGGVLRLFHTGPVDSATSLVFASVTILPIAVLIPTICRRWEDFADVLRWMAIANAVWIACAVFQFVFRDAGALTVDRSNRFVGLTSNPQHAGTYLAGAFVVALWLLLNDGRRKWRPLWWSLVGVNAVFIAWTGSRTGAAMAVIGTTVCLYSRVGRSMLYLPAVMVALWLSVVAAEWLGIELVTERLTSLDNTRAVAWGTMIASASKNPLLGAGILEAGDSENSYLYGFASYGIGMVLLMITMLFVAAIVSWKLYILRFRLPDRPRAVVEFTLAYIAMYFAGAVFEGYILARVAPPLVMILVVGGFAAAILNLAEDGVVEDEDTPATEPGAEVPEELALVDPRFAREY